MKKICSVFIAALLAVMLCVPAFATCSHLFVGSKDDDETHYCTKCGLVSECIFDGVKCIECGRVNLSLVLCPHMLDGNALVCYSSDDHYFYCLECDLLVPFSSMGSSSKKHTDSCSICASYENTWPVEFVGVVRCDSLFPMISDPDAEIDVDSIGYFYDSTDHYLCCLDCGAKIAISVMSGESVPHVDDCFFCDDFANSGYTFFDPNSTSTTPAQGIFPAISSIVTSAIEWLSAFVLCIVFNPLLLVFVVCVFVGLGIGLVKRIIRL